MGRGFTMGRDPSPPCEERQRASPISQKLNALLAANGANMTTAPARNPGLSAILTALETPPASKPTLDQKRNLWTAYAALWTAYGDGSTLREAALRVANPPAPKRPYMGGNEGWQQEPDAHEHWLWLAEVTLSEWANGQVPWS